MGGRINGCFVRVSDTCLLVVAGDGGGNLVECVGKLITIARVVNVFAVGMLRGKEEFNVE